MRTLRKAEGCFMNVIEQSSKNFPDSFFRVTVKGLYYKDGKILLVKESDELSGKWEMPGGGLDFGEDIIAGLKREIQEETGLVVTKVSKRPLYVWSWRFEDCRDMDWYYSLVIAYRIELENLDFTPSDECVEMRFFSKEDLQDAELYKQTNHLKTIFDPADFTEETYD